MGVTRITVVLTRAVVLAGVALVAVAGPARAATSGVSRTADTLREQDPGSFKPVSPADHVLGRIEIPRVGVSAPILEGVDDRTIRRAVGHFPETPLPPVAGNVALAAHRTTLFYGLRHIRIGDTITLTTPKGAFRYKVERTWVVDPADVSVLDASTDRILTLVTCYPFDYEGSAPKRFIVRAHAVPIARPAPEAGGVASAGSPGLPASR
jgi:sortase A